MIDPEYRINASNYSVTIGGIDEEKAYDMEIDNEGNIYACGWTSSSNFPVTPNAYQKNKFFSGDAIVFILEAKGEKLISSTFIGGDKDDMALGISLDENGNIYVAGTTSSSDFPVTETVYSRSLNNNSTDIFISKFNNNCSSLVYS
ncbi:MAG: SBBP repeat-containing protein, partial [Candidatus Thermoplasmatota archaeon]|nr:SBBP repeat-containing protein [Candidatus Thermoplasmatota archaeon]